MKEDSELGRTSGCSALVRSLQSALRGRPGASPVPASFWRRAAARTGQLAQYLSPDEACEIVSVLAEARLTWKNDAKSTEGLRRFADGAAQELGAFTPEQMGTLVLALGKLQFYHEELLQALSRAVEHAVQVETGRLNNEAACNLLACFRTFALLDEPVMKNMSHFFSRRIIREPLTAQQTAGVVAAYSELRARYTALFNATTIALCRPGAVDELTWLQVGEVAVSYASLRLYSANLFSRIQRRLCKSAGLDPALFSEEDTVTDWNRLVPVGLRESHLDELESQEPQEPLQRLPARVVVKLLEAMLHLGHVSGLQLGPLLPHLVHSVGPSGRPSMEMATLITMALGRGGHIWPWLWRRAAAGAFGDDGTKYDGSPFPMKVMLPLLEAIRSHLELLRPVLTVLHGAGGDEIAVLAATSPPLRAHLQVLAGSLPRLWALIQRNCHALSDVELKEVALVSMPAVLDTQALLGIVVHTRGLHAAASDTQLALERSAARAAQQLATELLRRQLSSEVELRPLLEQSKVKQSTVQEGLNLLHLDAVHG